MSVSGDRRRRLVPVRCSTVRGEPDGVHLSVYEWEPRYQEWITGPALCGQSADQGALPDGTPVTCTGFAGSCEGYRDSYERALAGRPTAEQEEMARLREENAQLREENARLRGNSPTLG